MMSPWSRIVVGFDGDTPPAWLVDGADDERPAGFIIGRRNGTDAAAVRRLTDRLQELAVPGMPFLIAADEEGGQLSAFAGITTPFPGAMALGAVGDPGLAYAVAAASGAELAALGVNVVLAPVVDVVTRPDNPSLGIRGFGGDPDAVAALGAAMVAGYRSAGIAATAKHFPGKGEAAVDPHHHLPVLDLDDARLDAVEFPPFVAAAAAGVDLMMIGHYAVPALTGDRTTPISTNPALRRVLRTRIGFPGVVISDALDMGAFTATGGSEGLLAAGIDALLCMQDLDRARAACVAIARSDPDDHAAACERLRRLRTSLPAAPDASRTAAPGAATRRHPGRIGTSEHRRLASEVAGRALTLVRCGDGILPLRGTDRILAVMPQPTDLTPADTSSHRPPLLATALRTRLDAVTEMVIPIDPGTGVLDAVRGAAAQHDVVVIGTIAADSHPGQVALVRSLAIDHPRVVTVALRTPFDLTAYPEAGTHVCTYSLLGPSMDALAAALAGATPASHHAADNSFTGDALAGAFPGRLPVAIPDLYPKGHGLG